MGVRSVLFDRPGSGAMTLAVQNAEPPLSPGPPVPVARRQRAHWRRTYGRALLLLDGGLAALSVGTALTIRFGVTVHQAVGGVSYPLIGLLVVAGWWFSLALHRSYEPRFLGAGPDEYRRVSVATFRAAAVTAIVGYVLKVPLARGFVAVAFPLGLALLLIGRWVARKLVWHGQARGWWAERLVVVGDREHVAELVRELGRDRRGSMQVVGACLPGGPVEFSVDGQRIPVIGSLTTVPEALALARADAVAVTASPGLTPLALRRLGWALEGTDIDLVVAPALTNVSGPRINFRPVAGLPLIHVEQPEFAGARKFVKELFDRGTAALALVTLSPVLLLLYVLVKATSPGPALFRQTRVGRGGDEFTLFKFRSMCVDAEQRRVGLAADNEGAGLLFKLRNDPRVTPVGRVLRRWSLDELPQLFNVVRGDMALVGPRPPIPDEVAGYESATHRRLLVKPGITGLWQVSGRSELSWEDYVRLDLQYVENWSLSLDLLILAKTFGAVLRQAGAY